MRQFETNETKIEAPCRGNTGVLAAGPSDAARQNETTETEIGAAQLRAVEALAQGASAAVAAQAVGVGRATIYRWLRDPRFVAALNGAKREHVAAAHAGMRKLADQAVAFVGHVLNSENCNYTMRLNIALKVLRAVGADRPEPLTDLDEEAFGQVTAR
jgi:hypothetical protein